MSAAAEVYLNALLALSGNALLVDAQGNLLRSIGDAELSRLVSQGMGREFARGGLEEIALLMLDVIARVPGTNGVKVAQSSVENTQGSAVSKSSSAYAATPPASTPGTSKKREADAHPEARVEKRPNTNDDCIVKPESQDDDSNLVFEAETGLAVFEKPSPDSERVERVLWIPKNSNGGIWLRPEQLPDELRAGIAQKFDDDFLCDNVRKGLHRSILGMKRKYVEYGCCLNLREHSRKTTACDHSKAGGNTDRVYNICIKTKRLCVRLVKVKEEIKLAIYPIPASFRASTVKWDDMEY